jgi:hypothetical protein
MYVILKYTWNFLEYCVKNYVFKIFCPCFGELRFQKKFSETNYLLVIALTSTLLPCALPSLRRPWSYLIIQTISYSHFAKVLTGGEGILGGLVPASLVAVTSKLYRWLDSRSHTSNSSSSPVKGLGWVSQAPWALRSRRVKYLIGWFRRLPTAQRTFIERQVMWESEIGKIIGLSGFSEI